jgi:hypothetical protein
MMAVGICLTDVDNRDEWSIKTRWPTPNNLEKSEREGDNNKYNTYEHFKHISDFYHYFTI